MTAEHPSGTTAQQYAKELDNAAQRTRERLAAAEAVFDPGTIRHLEALGVGAGWRCLEVGAGGGSITRWLCHRVGPRGHVVATDLDPRFLEALAEPNLEVRRHDIVSDPLDTAAFDLVYSRLVLEHLTDREQALGRMVAALKPGGWLLIEGFDHVTILADPTGNRDDVVFHDALQERLHRFRTDLGIQTDFGRRQFGLLRRQGLVQVQAEGHAVLAPGGSPYTQYVRLSVEQVRPRVLASGLMAEQEVDRYLALLDDPGFAVMSHLMVAAWGQRPQA